MNEEDNKRLGRLIFALACGNISVLDEIYQMLAKLLYAVGNIYYSQRADIEDAIQDLLILLYQNARKFKENKNACTWVIQIYQNMIRNRLRRQRTEDTYLSEQATLQSLIAKEDSSKYIENHLFISEIFDKLNEYEQNLIIYRFWGGNSIGETAEYFGKPKSTIESQLKALEEKIKKL